MGFDSMSAWSRHAFDFNDSMHGPYAVKPLSVSTTVRSPCSGGPWCGNIPLNSRRRKQIDQKDFKPRSPPRSPYDAPSFSEAKLQWSPPPSPRTRSLRASPCSSPCSPRSPQIPTRKDTAQLLGTPPLSPKDLSAFADKLYAAACAGDLKHLRLLLSLGAPINKPSMVENLYDAFRPAKPGVLSALAGAAGNGQLGAVKLLLANGASLNPAMRESSSSPLHQACRADDVEMAYFLLEAGADVNIINCYNTTPIMYAAGKNGSADMTQLILSHNPDLTKISFIGTSVIHWALFPGNEEVITLLLEAGACVDATVGDGSTALHYCAFSGWPSILQVLLRYGADPHKRNEEWKTPLQTAENAGQWEAAAILREAESKR